MPGATDFFVFLSFDIETTEWDKLLNVPFF